MTRLRLSYIHAFRDRHGTIRYYFRRSGKRVPLPRLPGSDEFMAAYQAALTGVTIQIKQIGEERTIPGTLQALIAAYLDHSPGSTSPFKALAPETKRTRRNILENPREMHGDKRIYRVDQYGRRVPLLTRVHVQRIINQKSNTPFAQRNLLNTLRAMFKWAVAEDRVPDDPTLGVNRQKIESAGYTTWSEDHIEQYRRMHALGTMPRLAIELILATAARRGDAVKLGRQHVCDGIIAFEQSKVRGRGGTPLTIPLHPDFCAALEAMSPSNVVQLAPATTFLTTSFGQPFKTAASFGNWFRQCCDQAGLPKGISAHGLRKATARRLAELGCTTHQIAAITGHATLSEVQRYTNAADRTRLAKEAMKKLTGDRP
jgi:site-specific recombinase XerD